MKITLENQNKITVVTYNFLVDGFAVKYKEFLNDSGRVIDWEIEGPQAQIGDEAVKQIQEMVGTSL